MPNLKMRTDHFEALKNAVMATCALYPNAVKSYTDAGLSNMRLNWDVARASTIDGQRFDHWASDVLYQYLNDTHINSALASIMGNDGANAKGKKR